MVTMGLSGRKWQVFTEAIEAFAEKGYEGISMRDIAERVGIRASSLYNHYQSKAEILDTIFAYDKYIYDTLVPTLELAVKDASDLRKHPLEGLYKINCYPDQETRVLRDKILVIAFKEMSMNTHAAELIRRDLVDGPIHYATRILNTLVSLERIEPINAKAFTQLFVNQIMGVSVRNYFSPGYPDEQWMMCLKLLFSLITLKEKPQAQLSVRHCYYIDTGWQ